MHNNVDRSAYDSISVDELAVLLLVVRGVRLTGSRDCLVGIAERFSKLEPQRPLSYRCPLQVWSVLREHEKLVSAASTMARLGEEQSHDYAAAMGGWVVAQTMPNRRPGRPSCTVGELRGVAEKARAATKRLKRAHLDSILKLEAAAQMDDVTKLLAKAASLPDATVIRLREVSEASAAQEAAALQAAADEKNERRCDGCKETFGKVLVCGGCRQRRFCSRACQVADWRGGHKEACKQLAEEAAKAKAEAGAAPAPPAQGSPSGTPHGAVGPPPPATLAAYPPAAYPPAAYPPAYAGYPGTPGGVSGPPAYPLPAYGGIYGGAPPTAMPSGPPPPRWAPAPHTPVPIRLLGGGSTLGGVVQFEPLNETGGGPGALCVPDTMFQTQYTDPNRLLVDTARVICRQLNLPYKGAYLVPPSFFPSVPADSMRARYFSGSGVICITPYIQTLTVTDRSGCPGVYSVNTSSPDAAAYSLDPSSGAAVVATAAEAAGGSGAELLGSCAAIPDAYRPQVTWLDDYTDVATWVPAAVVCSGTARPPIPPLPPSPAPPRPPPSPPRTDAAWLQLRLTNLTNVTYGWIPGVFGVLQVRLPDGSWGKVCGNPSTVSSTQAIAQYACRGAGLPYAAAVTYFNNYPNNNMDNGPVALTVARGCQLDLADPSSRLQCEVLGGPLLTPRLFAGINGSGVEGQLPAGMERYRGLLENAVTWCPAQAPLGYSSAVICMDTFFPAPPSRPPAPPRQPQPPLPPRRPWPPRMPYVRRNDLRLRWTEVMPHTCFVEFGVPRGSPANTTANSEGASGNTPVIDAQGVEWGTQCVPVPTTPGVPVTPSPDLSRATRATLCSQITGRSRPYGMIVPGTRPYYPQIITVPPYRLRINTTRVVVTELECGPNGTVVTAANAAWESDVNAPQQDINGCRATTPLPTLSLDTNTTCSFSSMASKFLYCTDRKFGYTPPIFAASTPPWHSPLVESWVCPGPTPAC
ncbi:hypothetical protein HYH03_001675 [Edaphochlamys debaryana]|uniref:Uncharacterized protein n=1 Tax=Edaphochlamys debaryana TaxID=47281 RepID=A0A835YLW2_9CHLO|nr:hypothetical protein HYH03_001675 [Edaphochlamys debaryana]|eukprot:KAG2500089.1 hypothetical protein HYH03_001675 [Edaphochlamys debaryana]